MEVVESLEDSAPVDPFENQVRFDPETYKVVPLTCSTLDAAWFMPLPEVIDADKQTVTISMQSDPDKDSLFDYNLGSKRVFISESMREDYLAGELCSD